jgi:hypothetical protein
VRKNAAILQHPQSLAWQAQPRCRCDLVFLHAKAFSFLLTLSVVSELGDLGLPGSFLLCSQPNICKSGSL